MGTPNVIIDKNIIYKLKSINDVKLLLAILNINRLDCFVDVSYFLKKELCKEVDITEEEYEDSIKSLVKNKIISENRGRIEILRQTKD